MKAWLSGLSFIFQAILVVAVILVFVYVDPFHLFVTQKLSLRDTPSHVKQIRAIGQLVSATYKGEVISSYQDIIQLEEVSAKNLMKVEIRRLDTKFKDSITAIKNLDIRTAENRFDRFYSNIENDTYFNIYIEKLIKTLKKNLLDPFRSNKNIVFNKFFKDKDKAVLAENDTSYYKPIFDELSDDIHDSFTTRKIKKSQLILIGRGEVQAGFDFGTFTEHNIKIDTLHNRIIIIGKAPEILSAAINPSFIPELNLKGFEIVYMSNKADNVAIINRVKKACVDSLKAKAIASDILKIAKENAELNLKHFFSLVLDNNTIDVKIAASEIDYYTQNLFDDNILIEPELKLLDSLTSAFLKAGTDSTKVLSLIDSIKNCKILYKNRQYPITPFTLAALKQIQFNDTSTAVLNTLKISDKWFFSYENRHYRVMPAPRRDSLNNAYLTSTVKFINDEKISTKGPF